MNKSVKIAMDITADYQYVYDPEHDDKPDGSWKRTNSGWSNQNGEKPDEKLVSQQGKPAKEEQQSQPVEKDMDTGEKPNTPADSDDNGIQLNLTDPKEEEPAEDAITDDDPAEEAPADNGDEETLFDDSDGEGFDTDDEGKQEEQLEQNGEQDEDAGLFSEENKAMFLNPDKYDEYMEKLNAFIEKFDEGEGKENDVTFKAIASNLDWDKVEDVKAFSEHCAKKELEGADEVLAFLYFIHQDDEEKFDGIVEDMK